MAHDRKNTAPSFHSAQGSAHSPSTAQRRHQKTWAGK